MGSVMGKTVAAPAPEHRLSVADVVEGLGFGPAQIKGAVLSGAVWFASGLMMNLVSASAAAVTEEMNLDTFERGFLATAVLIGVLFGNLASGTVSDRVGRRPPICASLAFAVCACALSTLAWSFLPLVCARIAMGCAIGLGQAAAQTLTTEISPSSWRLTSSIIAGSMWCVGSWYAAALIGHLDPLITADLPWRTLFSTGYLPVAVLLVLAVLLVEESPFYLAAAGEAERSREVLISLCHSNGVAPLPSTWSVTTSAAARKDQEQGEGGLWRQLGVVFGPRLRGTTCILMLTCFVLNFVYYGFLFAFPLIAGDLNLPGTPAEQVAIGVGFEFIGGLIPLVCGSLPRKFLFKVYLVLLCFAILMFSTGIPWRPAADGGAPREEAGVAVYFGFYMMKLVVTVGFTVVYQYCSEVGPTAARSTGVAVALACGRVASLSAPMVFELMLKATGTPAMYFATMIVLSALNLALVDALPYETAGRPLPEFDDVPAMAAFAKEAAPDPYNACSRKDP